MDSSDSLARLGRLSAGAEHQVVQLRARQDLTPFPARLRKRTNICYVNRTVKALLWMAELSGTNCGTLQPGRRFLRATRSIHLPGCVVLRHLFASWTGLHQQHDAGEFLAHCLVTSQAGAWQGGWESRLSMPHRIVDSSTLLISLQMGGPNLWTQTYRRPWECSQNLI